MFFFAGMLLQRSHSSGPLQQIADFVYYCFFIIDSLGVIPKYSLYLCRKFFRFFNPIIPEPHLQSIFRFLTVHGLFPFGFGI